MEEEIKSIVFGVVLKSAIAAVVSAIPILNWPIISTIFSWVITGIATKIFANVMTLIDFRIIDAKVTDQNTEYKKALSLYMIAVQKPGVNDADKKAAKDDLKAKLAALIHFDH